ncbi:AAA family ATPase [Chondrinema litorale]|uniref:AAA family ATPase n=1 Tax=Chondrinema litorale TaxID=2994555 RepID=UPI00254364BC|nr:MoxR family ATPase [Chondrinema litorale]UZR93935.1 MoxR family ATPase [Chondrinema litorale]
MTEKDVHQLIGKIHALKAEIQKVIIGQEDIIDQLLICFMAGGHALLEGVPGLAKTLMIRTLSEAVHLNFKRIQFTPDLMPADITGTEVLEEDITSGKKFFKFNHGPIFANIILADEINRTPPKTQAALLEAMQEYEVTYGGKTYSLEKPFFILATQNPVEQSGTFPLPEAQLDRFLFYIQLGYPEEQDEFTILSSTTGSKKTKVESVITGEEIAAVQQLVREVPVNDTLISRVNRIVRATRPQTTSVDMVKSWVQWGAGPRAGQAMMLTAKAAALLDGRFAVTPNDIEKVAYPVLRHRMLMNFKAEASGKNTDEITSAILQEIKA